MYLCCEEMQCKEKEMSVMPENPQLAHAYVPFQVAGCLFTTEKGLQEGTIFPELVMPYKKPGWRCPNE